MTRLGQSSTAKLIFLGLVWLTLIFLMPPYADNFVGDDYFQLNRVTELVAQPSTAWQILNPFWQPWYYRPWQNGWILANRLIFGFNPFGFYWSQLLMHLLAMALLFRVSRRIGVSRWAGLTAVALFGLHGHWFDTVTWIASIAIVSAAVFSLAALWCFLEFLDEPQSAQRKNKPPSVASVRSVVKYEYLTALFVILALFTHEEGFLLPIFLVIVWLYRQGDWRKIRLKRMLAQRDGRLLILLLALDLIYLLIQLFRPNELISAAAGPAGGWLAAINFQQIGLYGAQWVVRGLALLNQPPPLVNPVVVILFAGLGAALLAYWFIRGNHWVRLGLAWLGLHVGFIFLALWVQKPNFFAGRHLYQGMLGAALAVGGGLDQLATHYRRRRERQRVQQISVGLATAVLLYFAFTLQNMQQNWADTLVAEDKSVAAQMKELMPAVSADTHVFANRFSTAAAYLPAHVMVWYDQPLSEPGGNLFNLRDFGHATRDFYVFDYDAADGRLLNLMPELQAHDETIFLWSQTPAVERIDAPENSTPPDSPTMKVMTSGDSARLTFSTDIPDEGWVSWVYTQTIPGQSRLAFSVRGENVSFRVRLTDESGVTHDMYEVGTAGKEWENALVPLEEFWNQTVAIRLESAGNSGHWANPRLVID